jgi:hypothetical protein
MPAIVRLRQIGEHGVAAERSDLDPRRNTSTTVARGARTVGRADVRVRAVAAVRGIVVRLPVQV